MDCLHDMGQAKQLCVLFQPCSKRDKTVTPTPDHTHRLTFLSTGDITGGKVPRVRTLDLPSPSNVTFYVGKKQEHIHRAPS